MHARALTFVGTALCTSMMKAVVSAARRGSLARSGQSQWDDRAASNPAGADGCSAHLPSLKGLCLAHRIPGDWATGLRAILTERLDAVELPAKGPLRVAYGNDADDRADVMLLQVRRARGRHAHPNSHAATMLCALMQRVLCACARGVFATLAAAGRPWTCVPTKGDAAIICSCGPQQSLFLSGSVPACATKAWDRMV